METVTRRFDIFIKLLDFNDYEIMYIVLLELFENRKTKKILCYHINTIITRHKLFKNKFFPSIKKNTLKDIVIKSKLDLKLKKDIIAIIGNI